MPSTISAPKTDGTHTTVEIHTSGCLFDLDGTLMLSTACVEAFWHDFGKSHNIDAEELLKTSHGRRTIDVFKMWKPEYATEEDSAKFEATIPKRWKHIATPVPGVQKFLNSLPRSQWGIVTSGTYVMANQWIEDFLGIQHPEVFITAEHIKEGKPNPEGYLKGHKDLGLLKNFLVFEDAPAGVKAGKDAGATVIGMATTYSAEQVKSFGADIVIPSMEHIKLKSWNPETKELVLTVIDPVA